MQLNLTRTLVERGIIGPGTEIEALYDAIDLSGLPRASCKGVFVVLGVKRPDDPVFEIAGTDGKRKRITSEAILAVDGMEPTRLASIYNIKSDGSVKPEGKRRGRKPKNREPIG